MLRIGFCSTWPATDPNAYSGYAFSIRGQLKRDFEVVDLLLRRRWLRLPFLGHEIVARGLRRYYSYEREPLYLDTLARTVEHWAIDARLDAIVCPSSIPMTRYRGPVPAVVVTDQVFHSALGTYLSRPSSRYRRLGIAQERQALANCAAVSFPTQAAVEAAVRDCGADPAKVHEIAWGANLPSVPERGAVERALRSRARDVVSLVFIGREWKRKGGDLVLATMDELRRRGVACRLVVIGTEPDGFLSGDVRVIRFLDKQTPAGWQQFVEIMSDAHFLFVPSRAEAFGHVYCEAAAFGVPAVAQAVGGVPSVVRDGSTGIVVDPSDATPASFGARIAELWSDRDAYEGMALSARRDYEERLNWDQFGIRFRRVVEGVLR
jgi:glycosyltransferase involved in cell wall biosynthesis